MTTIDHYAVIGNARRVTPGQARDAFAAGATVVVSEYGDQDTRPVSRSSVTHTRDTTTWEKLAGEVAMWQHRSPGQTFYVLEETNR